MKAWKSLAPLLAVSICIFLTASSVRAAEPKVEVGAALASVMTGLGDNEGTVFGVPSSGFGFLNPDVYASVFLGSYLAIEPQLGVQWASSGGHSEHVVNLTGQVDYFILGSGTRSPYVFGSAGLVDVSGSSITPKTFSGGFGYRIPVGDSLAIRFDGHATHFTEGGGNALFFAVSIGGVFGSR